MKKILLSSVMMIGLLTLLLSPTNANAGAGFVYKTVSCPKNGAIILPAGNRVEISDVVVSANGNTGVTLRFTPGPIKFLTLHMKANTTVVTNFTGQLESADEQAIKVDCDGVDVSISVTIVGTEAF